MKAPRIDMSMSVIILVASLLSTVGSDSYGADPTGVSPPSGKHWVVTFEDDFMKDIHHYTTHRCGAAASHATRVLARLVRKERRFQAA